MRRIVNIFSLVPCFCRREGHDGRTVRKRKRAARTLRSSLREDASLDRQTETQMSRASNCPAWKQTQSSACTLQDQILRRSQAASLVPTCHARLLARVRLAARGWVAKKEARPTGPSNNPGCVMPSSSSDWDSRNPAPRTLSVTVLGEHAARA